MARTGLPLRRRNDKMSPVRKRKSSTPESRPANTAAARPLGIWVALILINIVVYGAVRHFELVNWDDPTYITENATVLRGLSWNTAWWALTTRRR